MKRRLLASFFFGLFSILLTVGEPRAQEIVKVGVLPLRVYSADPEIQRNWPTQAAKILSAELGKDERILLVEEKEIQKAMEKVGRAEGEEQLAREVGRDLGADYMVTGSITQIDGSISVDVRMLNVYGEGVLASVFAVGKRGEGLEPIIRQASREVNIKLLKKELVAKVLVEGNRAIESSAIRAQIKTKEGDVYSPTAIREDLRAIYRMGYFRDVRVDMRDWGRERAVVFVVEEKPIIKEVKFSGNKNIKTSDLLEVINLKPRTVLDLNLVKENVEKIIKKYHDEAYFAAEVNYEIKTPKKGDVIVLFTIRENEKMRIQKILFSGNFHFSDETLRKQLPETQEENIFSWVTKAGTYKEETLERDLDGIIAFYLLKGFLQVKVGKPRITTDRKGITIRIPIEEGRQFKVGRVEIQGDLIAPQAELFKLVRVYVGEIFDREKVRQTISNLTDRYADQGYAFVDVSPETILHPDQSLVDLTFHIKKGSKVYFERVNILGNTKTRDRVIRRDVMAVEGEVYSLSAMKKSRENLNYLNYFKQVNITTKKGSADDKMVVNVEVEEGPTGSVSGGVGYSTTDKFVGIFSVSQNNLFGRGQRLTASAQLGSISKYYSLSFIEPRLFDTHILTGADLYNTYRDYDDYSTKRTGGLVRVGYPLFELVRGYNQYRYELVNTYNIAYTASDFLKSQAGDSTTSSIYQEIRRDARDNRLDPTRGSDNSGSIEYAGGFLGGSNYFTKYQGNTLWYTTPFWSLTFSARGRIGYIQENAGHAIPLEERYRLGGINTIRGFKAYSIGPKDSQGEVIGGNKELIFNFEMLFPIAKEIKLKGLIFFDAGNAWDVGQSYSLTDLRTSVGFGFRWVSPVGPLRLEWGYNLDPKEGESHSAWDFTIGAAF
jgi:outer membrane protein insertion porin family